MKNTKKDEFILKDEDFKLKNEEFMIKGEDLRKTCMKMKKIKNFSFINELQIKK